MKPALMLSLYLFVQLVILTNTGTSDYTADDVASWHGWDWFRLIIGILSGLAMMALAFFDNSLAKWKSDKIEEEKTAVNNETKTP